MDLTPNHKLKDYIKIDRILQPTFHRVATFPEIIRDDYDRYVGIVTLQGERVEDPMVAFLIDLIRWGNEKLASYGSLRTALKEGEEIDVPDYKNLPHEIMRDFTPSRPLKLFFKFSMEMPPGLKWSVKNEKKQVQSTKNFHLPTLCAGNRGYASVYAYEGHGTGFDAACLAAIQMGHQLTTCDNGVSNLHVDDSVQRVAYLKGRMEAPDFVKVVEDSGWGHDKGTSISHRGINDYNRRVRFERKPSDEEMTLFKELLSLDKCPGWTGIYAKGEDVAGLAYTFRTTWDSSD